MSVETSAWIGYGVEVKFASRMLGEWPKEYDGWSPEEILEALLGNDFRIRRSGTEAYGGRGSWFVVVKETDQRLGFTAVKLKNVDRFLEPGWDLELDIRIGKAIAALKQHSWIKVEGAAGWLGAVWMH